MVSRRTAVVLIDLENQTDLRVKTLQGHLARRFYLIDQLAFADYSRPALRSVAGRIMAAGVTPVHVDTAQPGGLDGTGGTTSFVHNGVDWVMAKILDRFAKRDHIYAIVVVSGDNYFVQPIKRARRVGKRVIVAANPDRTGRRLQRVASEFVSLRSYTIH
jgi:bifunctional ADP-heptose synthase (sugar kinase/adenylyltransferase)